MDDRPPEDHFNSPLGSIDGFYERMERIDAVSLSLGLRLGEFIMRDCLPAGRLHKKHFMAEMNFIKITKFTLTAWGHS